MPLNLSLILLWQRRKIPCRQVQVLLLASSGNFSAVLQDLLRVFATPRCRTSFLGTQTPFICDLGSETFATIAITRELFWESCAFVVLPLVCVAALRIYRLPICQHMNWAAERRKVGTGANAQVPTPSTSTPGLQNLARNGANSNSTESYKLSMSRNKLSDQPAIVFYSLIGMQPCILENKQKFLIYIMVAIMGGVIRQKRNTLVYKCSFSSFFSIKNHSDWLH